MNEISGKFEQSSPDWQIQQIQQRVGEQLDRFWQWIERLLMGHQGTPAEGWELPDWLLKGLFWLIVPGLVAWLLWQLYKLLSPYLNPALRTNKKQRLNQSLVQAKELTIAEWLQRSRQSQQQGDYGAACRSLYMAALQHLNDRDLVRQEPSRTDGEYLSLVQILEQSQPYQILIHAHEQLCFSRAAASVELFDRCWQAYQEISRP
jgi:hypothetical protein